MSDAPESPPFPSPTAPLDRRLAAVLLLVRHSGAEGAPMLTFIRRTERVPSHKGQISFPGGGYKAEADGTLENAALREAQEELGLDPASLKILGSLPPVDTVVSSFIVHPFVAVPRDNSVPITYIKDEFEVADVLEIPLLKLLDPTVQRTEQWVFGGQARPVHFFTVQPYVIWGATARILLDFQLEMQAGKWAELLNHPVI